MDTKETLARENTLPAHSTPMDEVDLDDELRGNERLLAEHLTAHGVHQMCEQPTACIQASRRGFKIGTATRRAR